LRQNFEGGQIEAPQEKMGGVTAPIKTKHSNARMFCRHKAS